MKLGNHKEVSALMSFGLFRIEWQRVKVIQLFIEHVAMNCSMNNDKFIEFVRYAKRINEVSYTLHCHARNGAIIRQ